jgi:diacylglycerol kinase family enzyme
VTRETPFFVVLNARSGSRDAGGERDAISAVFVGAGQRHEFLLIEDPAHLPQLARRAAELARDHEGAVVAAGGDGTINAVVQAALPERRPFGIIPQGTFNYSCRAHGIPLDSREAATALLSPVLKPVQVGLVNGHVFLVNASLGLYPELLEDREAFKKHLGRRRSVAALAALSTLLHEHRQLALDIVHDGQGESLVTPSLFIGNNALQLDQAGLPEAEALERRRLAAVVLAPVSPAGLLRLAVRGAFGKLADAAEVRSFDFKRLRVARGRGFGRNRLKVATDGEIVWMNAPLEFSVAGQPLYLMTPPPSENASPS